MGSECAIKVEEKNERGAGAGVVGSVTGGCGGKGHPCGERWSEMKARFKKDEVALGMR